MGVREGFTLKLGLKGWRGEVILEDKTAKKALVIGTESTVTQLLHSLGKGKKRVIEDGAGKKGNKRQIFKGVCTSC